ncbi:cerebellar degeneration-related protein 2 [Trichomycterus rosablanca]|uniref:cerebellar degeneration-related protein 2 n=1 Tax=Trichomycterus rosablanca TaxID=2290929 RepID=UPI002F3581A7
MLTDVMTEEPCEHRDEEPWFHQQDLERDLHLAAELGKTLLERNHELEHSVRQMCSENQERLKEIEHLTKQVETLRTVMDQHAKVNEQLNTSAEELEQSKQRLVLEKHQHQIKIQRLTETVHALHVQVEELQKEVETLKTKQEPEILEEPQRPDRGQSDSYPLSERSVSPGASTVEEDEEDDEEHTNLLTSVQVLQTRLISERCLREAAEHEVEELAQKIRDFQPRLALLDDYQVRLAELQTEVVEMKQRGRSGTGSEMLPGTVFYPSPEETCEIWQPRPKLKRCSSEESACRGLAKETPAHAAGCLEAVESSGVSLLSEVDAQYRALQKEYDALLRQLQSGRLQSDKAVQTPSGGVGTQDDAQLPEYKTLFREIFTHIQKAKRI